MKHVWTVLCQKSIVEKDTDRISLLNALDSLGFIVSKEKLQKEKSVPVNLEILSCWSRCDGEVADFLVKIEFINVAKNKVLIASEEKIISSNNELPAEKLSSLRSRLLIPFLPIESAGAFIFKISQKKKNDSDFSVVAELPLEIKIKYK